MIVFFWILFITSLFLNCQCHFFSPSSRGTLLNPKSLECVDGMDGDGLGSPHLHVFKHSPTQSHVPTEGHTHTEHAPH